MSSDEARRMQAMTSICFEMIEIASGLAHLEANINDGEISQRNAARSAYDLYRRMTEIVNIFMEERERTASQFLSDFYYEQYRLATRLSDQAQSLYSFSLTDRGY